jgi:hypothetical protein
VIDDVGRIGGNTLTPIYSLDVNAVDASIARFESFTLDEATNGWYSFSIPNTTWRFVVNGSARGYITPGGPAWTFQRSSASATLSIGNSFLVLGNGEGDVSNAYYSIAFRARDIPFGGLTNAPAYIAYRETTTTGEGSGDLAFFTRNVTTDTLPTERLTILADGSLNLGTAGVKLTQDGDGALTFLGLGNGSDEDLTLNLDDTADTAVWSSSTGVATWTLTSITMNANAYSVAGTAGGTGTTCTAFTSGLCTAASLEPSALERRVVQLERELLALRDELKRGQR